MDTTLWDVVSGATRNSTLCFCNRNQPCQRVHATLRLPFVAAWEVIWVDWIDLWAVPSDPISGVCAVAAVDRIEEVVQAREA